MDIHQSNQASQTEVQRFYRNAVVFLTGATGFIGKLYLEKILRSLPVKKVYILVRSKNDAPVEKRIEKIFESPIFDSLKRTNPEALKKVNPISGDLFLPSFGISNGDRQTLANEVNVIVHCAATTRFNARLKNAVFINIRGTRDIISLAKDIQDLKSFCVVGTAYSNCNQQEIGEKFYPSTITAEKLIDACENLDDDAIDYMTEKIIDGWPNTYSFTKQVAEDLIRRECQNLPVFIARPTIVVSTANEPVTAYVDNFFTLAGFVTISGLGICRIGYYKNGVTDIIPADMVVNQCIVVGWHTGQFVDGIQRIHKFQELYEPFTTREFFYHNENTQRLLKKMSFEDKEMFNFDITTINWMNYFKNYVRGLRVYLLDDGLETLPKARVRGRMLKLYFFLTVYISIALGYFLIKWTIFFVVPFFTRILLNSVRSFVC